MNDFTAPHIEYGTLSPLLIVFGVALLGVLVEAFVPARTAATSCSRCSRWSACSRRFVATIVVATTSAPIARRRGARLDRRRGRHRGRRPDGLPLGRAAGAVVHQRAALRRASPRRRRHRVRRPGGRPAGHRGRARRRRRKGLEHTEVFPLMMFAVGGMMLFPASNDLLTMFVALEVLSLPLYLLCGLARRRRLLSQEAALKYFMLGAFSSGFFVYGVALVYGYAGSTEPHRHLRRRSPAASAAEGLLLGGIALLAVGMLFKIGAAPFHAWTPDVYQGAPTAVTAFMAACTKIAAFGALLRLFYVALRRCPARLDADDLDHRDPHDGRRVALRADADRHQADAGLLLDRARGLRARRLRRAAAGDRRRRRDLLAAGGALLPGDLRLHDRRRVRRRDAGPRRRWRGEPPVAVGRARQGVAGRGRCLRVLPARHGRHPAHQRLHRQVGGLHLGRPGRRLAAGRRSRCCSAWWRRSSTCG